MKRERKGRGKHGKILEKQIGRMMKHIGSFIIGEIEINLNIAEF